MTLALSPPATHPLVPELREGIYDDTEHDVQPDGRDDDEEGDVKQDTQARRLELLGYQRDHLDACSVGQHLIALQANTSRHAVAVAVTACVCAFV